MRDFLKQLSLTDLVGLGIGIIGLISTGFKSNSAMWLFIVIILFYTSRMIQSVKNN